MIRHRGARTVWFRIAAALTVMLWVVGASIAADAVKAKKAARGASAGLPEVVRSSENDDVDGTTRKPKAPAKPRGSATLQPSQLDELILKELAATKTAVSEPTNDEQFVRRVYLDVVGNLPEPGEIRQFVASRTRNKRTALIETLLHHPDYAQNWARYWRDVVSFRSPNESDRQVNYPAFEKWLAEQFAANKPWDKIATEIITATGRSDENGATVFAIAETGAPVEMAGEVSRIFLGIQIQCAQCHDHPSDPWKRQQFHEFAAFFTGVKSRRAEKAAKGQAPIFMVATNGSAHYTMIDLKNPEKKIPVSPRFFLNDAPRVSEQVRADQRLILAAQYVTDPENPWFARAFINRVWYSLMGEGFYNPVDDLGPTRTPNSPEILDLVADQWIQSGYDIRWLFRTILNTQAYQRSSRSTNTAAGRTPFASNVPSRLRADQIYDALTHALDLDRERDQLGAMPERGRAKAKAKKAADPTTKRGRKVTESFSRTFGFDPSTPNDDVLGTIPQALFLMNSPLVTKEIQARPASMLGFLLMTHPDNRSILEIIYLRALGRRPTDREVRACSHHLNAVGNRAEAFEDILWALINSTEFLSRR